MDSKILQAFTIIDRKKYINFKCPTVDNEFHREFTINNIL